MPVGEDAAVEKDVGWCCAEGGVVQNRGWSWGVGAGGGGFGASFALARLLC